MLQRSILDNEIIPNQLSQYTIIEALLKALERIYPTLVESSDVDLGKLHSKTLVPLLKPVAINTEQQENPILEKVRTFELNLNSLPLMNQ